MTTNENLDALPVLIIGAGSCGLAIAHGLKRAAIPAIVFERDPDIYGRVGPKDWAVACHWSGPILAKLVGGEKWSRIQEVGVDPSMTVETICDLGPPPILHGVTGELLSEMTTDGVPFFRFLHSRLVAYLADGVDVRYNKTLDHFSCEQPEGRHPGVLTAYFTDGTEVRGRLLIGADGARSRVRSLLFEQAPEQAALGRLPYAATFVNASFTADQARFIRDAQRHPVGCVLPHPKGRICMMSVLDAPEAEQPETWVFRFYVGFHCAIEEQDRKATPHERLQEAKRIVRDDGIGEPIKSAFAWLDDDHPITFSKLACWDPSLPEHKWDNHHGLVTLAGDAAHPMTYHRGQGLNHAIADAGKIVDLLSKPGSQSQEVRIDQYEDEMRERGGQEVRSNEQNSRMVHDWEAVMKSPLITRGVQVHRYTSVKAESAA